MPPQTNLAQLPVGRIGFGAMRITGPGILGPPTDEGEAIALLRRAVEKGVSFIDTADSYGPGISETLIADALYPYPAGLVVATKGGLVRPGPDRWVTDCRPEHLRRACADSLKRLRVECVDCGRQACEAVGGKLVGGWYCFGEYDVVFICDVPNNESMSAIALAVAAGGAAKASKTTVLMSGTEGVGAMKKADAVAKTYKPDRQVVGLRSTRSVFKAEPLFAAGLSARMRL